MNFSGIRESLSQKSKTSKYTFVYSERNTHPLLYCRINWYVFVHEALDPCISTFFTGIKCVSFCISLITFVQVC